MTCHPEDHEIANNISELKQNTNVGKKNKNLSKYYTSNLGDAVGEHSILIAKLPCVGLPGGGLPSSACDIQPY
jgi:hypothetical protein